MKSCYNPYNEQAINSNKYVQQIVNCLNEINIDARNIKEVLFNYGLFKEVKIFNLNWYESIESKNKFYTYIKFIFRVLLIYFLKINKKKIIWTVHNKEPHNTKYYKLSLKIMKLLCKKSDSIIIHCDKSKDVLSNLANNETVLKKIVYIPHPNYIGVYKSKNTTEDYKILEKNSNDELLILFFGQVRPYKNVELLIEAVKESNYRNIKLIIAGKPCNNNYKDNLEKLINGDLRIKTIFRFIDDEEILMLINKSNILAFPYDLNSTLNSGSILLAFSNKKTVIASKVGTLEHFDSSLFFSYEYNTYEEHKKELQKQIEIVYKLFNENKEELNRMGDKLYNVVREKNSINNIAKDYKMLYRSLIEKS